MFAGVLREEKEFRAKLDKNRTIRTNWDILPLGVQTPDPASDVQAGRQTLGVRTSNPARNVQATAYWPKEVLGMITGSIMAQERKSMANKAEFSFLNCTINGTGLVWLGRALSSYPLVVFIRTFMPMKKNYLGRTTLQGPDTTKN
ncbi:putative pectinesterase 14 [Cinnamomum micranthum f. kanehirae]|uniref:Putative pectinesterase 14 n=1 Tax=Cinnamomum micranthum f. kanehirae TaxID=337451 RepID=A0A443PSS9_9MAGN|nr:putative pectinesterase 14 [Cinnamomum micranthum f. kanehirae]